MMDQVHKALEWLADNYEENRRLVIEHAVKKIQETPQDSQTIINELSDILRAIDAFAGLERKGAA